MNMIMINLFEIFDPSIGEYQYQIQFKIQFNWLYMFAPIILFPNLYWLIPSRLVIIYKLIVKYLFNEFKIVITNKYIINAPIFLRIVIYIILLNLVRLFPYVFTLTRHLMFNLSISVSLWFRFMVYSIINIPKKILRHLVPLNSPKLLIHFIVIIELIRLIIRPWTLAIRLSANLISGHLILILLRNFLINFISYFPFSLLIETILLLLEISMAFIQSYVFSILLILYFSESTN
jgi:F-type H+-transporting ATPase subunit a